MKYRWNKGNDAGSMKQAQKGQGDYERDKRTTLSRDRR